MQAVNPTANSEDSEMCFLVTFDLTGDANDKQAELTDLLVKSRSFRNVENPDLTTTLVICTKSNELNTQDIRDEILYVASNRCEINSKDIRLLVAKIDLSTLIVYDKQNLKNTATEEDIKINCRYRYISR